MAIYNASYGGTKIYDSHLTGWDMWVFYTPAYLGKRPPPDFELPEAEFLEDSAVHLGYSSLWNRALPSVSLQRTKKGREWGTKAQSTCERKTIKNIAVGARCLFYQVSRGLEKTRFLFHEERHLFSLGLGHED